jgi:23S rRNA (adenine2030-N6)-methyltransferase
VLAIWYPVIERRWVERYERALRAAVGAVSTYELSVARERREGGLVGSGLFVVNAPWQLDDELGEALPWLAQRLGIEREAHHRVAT